MTPPVNALASVLTAFPRVKVLVVGDLVADHYVYGQTERVSREAPVLIVRHESETVVLGGAANAAANARALGAQVTALGMLGRDAMGTAMQRAAEKLGITLRAVRHPGVPTETKTRVLAGGHNTSRQQMLRLDRGHLGPLPAGLEERLAAQTLALGARADVVIVSDYGAGVIGAPVRKALQQLRRQGVTVCVDSRFALARFRQMSLCKPNEPELAALTGLPVETERQVTRAGLKALQLLKARALVVTRGKNGMALFAPGTRPQFIAGVGPRDAVDVTGAGDTVNAALALALGTGADLPTAAALANVAGSLVVQKPGTATVSPHEIRAALHSPAHGS